MTFHYRSVAPNGRALCLAFDECKSHGSAKLRENSDDFKIEEFGPLYRSNGVLFKFGRSGGG